MVLTLTGLLFGGVAIAGPVSASTLFEPPTTRTVIIERGQTMWQIAKDAVPSQDPTQTIIEILELNGLRRVELLHPGDRLLVPTR